MRNNFLKIKNRCSKTAKKVIRFTTDGCSFAPNFNFRDCCEEHDQDYAKAHRTNEKKRAKADRKLRLCIKCKGWKYLCWLYWLGVRIFGWIPFWILSKRKPVDGGNK